MIRNHWYAIALSGDVDETPHHVKRFGDDLVLWRDVSGQLACLRNRCAHRGAALSQGRIKDGCIECPMHGFRYDGTGRCTTIPAHGCDAAVPTHVKVQAFPVREAHGLIWMWWGDVKAPLPPLPWLGDVYPCLQEGARYVEIAQESRISPCRFMEANLDFAHFVFVHRGIPIAGAGPVLRDFDVRVDDDLIRVAGTFGPEKPGKKPPAPFAGAVRFPSLAAYNTPGAAATSLVAMAPVDDEHTWFTYRIYPPAGRFMGLRLKVTDWFMLRFVFERVIHPQDMRILDHQQPVSSGLEGDLLVSRADRPIREFLKMWAAGLAEDGPARQGATRDKESKNTAMVKKRPNSADVMPEKEGELWTPRQTSLPS